MWLILALATGCDDKPKTCDALWTRLNGAMESTAEGCATFVGTTAAAEADKSYWDASFQLQKQPTSTVFELSASFSRPTSDAMFPVELVFRGGNFAAAQGRYFFWESQEHWWRPPLFRHPRDKRW